MIPFKGYFMDNEQSEILKKKIKNQTAVSDTFNGSKVPKYKNPIMTVDFY